MPKLPSSATKAFSALSVIIIVIISALLRNRAVNQLPFDYDEDDYLRAAQLVAAEIRSGNLSGLQETNYRPEHPPLNKIVYGLAIFSLPQAPLLPDLPTSAEPYPDPPQEPFLRARTVSAVFGLLEVLLLAVINPVAGFFLGIHTFTIKYHSQIMLEALPALTSALTVLCYSWAKARQGEPKPGLWLVLSAIFLGLTAASKYIYCIVGVVILIDMVWTAQKIRSWKIIGILLIWGLVAVGFFIASNPYLWPAPVERMQESVLYHSGYASGASEVQRADFPAWQPFIWLFGSVPWHPGVFIFSLDLLITIFAFLGFRSLWMQQRIYGLWIVVSLAFLLIWPTKWPQYILVLTFPWSLAAAYGIRETVWLPFLKWRTHKGLQPSAAKQPAAYSDLRQAILWLLPGALVIALITFYPLIFQSVMSFTDFTARSLRDGLNGGIWRAFFQGITLQEQAGVIDFSFFTPNQTVHYLGTNLLNMVFAYTPDLIFFDLMWTVLVVGLQIGLGTGIAMILNQKGLRLKQFWLVLFILPWAIPEFVGALSWLQVIDPHNGWFALSGQSFGEISGNPFVAAIASWQDSSIVALLVLLAVGVWMGFPIMMLATTAGLKLVPREVYDAAAIDGAAGWALFRQITWPMVLPLVAPVIILRAIFAFNQFYLFYVLNPPGGLATFSIVSYFYFDELGLYSASAALNVFSVVILIIMLVFFNRFSRANKGVDYV